jgi:4-amino-4-deoxychorismate lyase
MNCWVNGVPGTQLDVFDRSVQYGDGLFETMRVRRNGIRLLAFHLERLDEGCRRLHISGLNLPGLRRELKRVAAQQTDAVLKLIVTRGVGARGYRPDGRERCTRIVSLHPLAVPAVARSDAAVRVRLCRIRLGTNAALAGLKTLNRLESVLARAEWRDPRIWEGLMRDAEGTLVCGTMSNLFVLRNSILSTPLLDRCGIAGVMRRWVISQALAMKFKVVETRIGWEDLCNATEAFMTNAVTGVVPVASVRDGRTYLRFDEHAAARELMRRLELE